MFWHIYILANPTSFLVVEKHILLRCYLWLLKVTYSEHVSSNSKCGVGTLLVCRFRRKMVRKGVRYRHVQLEEALQVHILVQVCDFLLVPVEHKGLSAV